MVKKLLFFLLFLTVSLINAQDPSGLTLSEARPFCSDSGAQFPNTHNGSNSLPGPVPIVEEETMESDKIRDHFYNFLTSTLFDKYSTLLFNSYFAKP